jgi:hypothetical protein
MCVVSREESTVNVRCLHLTMNTIKEKFSLSVIGGFAPSGFFKKSKVKASQQAPIAVRKHYEAATSAQAARLNGLLSRRTTSPL